jgi:hypothetical protein
MTGAAGVTAVQASALVAVAVGKMTLAVALALEAQAMLGRL